MIDPSTGAQSTRAIQAQPEAKRGDFIAPEGLREVTPLATARREVEKYAKAFDRVRTAAMKLLKAQGWTAAKGVHLQKLRELLNQIKTQHDAAVAKYERVLSSRHAAKQPELYAKPLGSAGLSLRPDELPEPLPAKEKKQPKGKKPPKEKKPPREKAPPKEKQKDTPSKKPGRVRATWVPPTNLPQSGLAGNYSVLVEAVPNKDFAGSPGAEVKHQATIRIPARAYPASTLGGARELLRAFVETKALGAGSLLPTAGRVRLDGKPFAHISFNGRIWAVDGKWEESGRTGSPARRAALRSSAALQCRCRFSRR